MASEIEDGGPAFPCPDNGSFGPQPGMTYRQWLVGQVAPTMLADYLRQCREGSATFEPGWKDGVSLDAVGFADAIIRAQKGRTQ